MDTCIVPGDEVMSLSLWEPWATLMAIGAKTIETRSWSTSYRGPLLICASARRNRKELVALFTHPHFADALEDEPLNYRHAVALVDLDGCETTSRPRFWSEELKRRYRIEESFGDYSAGRFAWLTSGRRRLKPFPVKGKQGLFKVKMPEFQDYAS